jgi:hypothetical protein
LELQAEARKRQKADTFNMKQDHRNIGFILKKQPTVTGNENKKS